MDGSSSVRYHTPIAAGPLPIGECRGTRRRFKAAPNLENMPSMATNSPPGGIAQAPSDRLQGVPHDAPATTQEAGSSQASVQPAADATRDSARPTAAPRIKKSEAARRIRESAEVAATLEIRDRLRQLAEQVGKGATDPQQAEFVEASILECLDEAAVAPPLDRWLACESSAWALAWMARARRAGGSSGGLLERLVGEARGAEPLLEEGDTLPARFVFTLARLFCDIETCRRLEPAASTAVAAEIDRLTSVRGIVNVAGSSGMIERVVRWTRFREIAEATGAAAWGEATERRWREAATNAVRLLGDDGRRINGSGLMPVRFTAPLLVAVAALGGRRKRAVEAVCRKRSGTGKPKRFIRRDLHDAAAAVAIMRSDWEQGSLRVLVDYRQPMPHLEIAVGDRMLINGPWQWSVSDAGGPLEAEGPWRASCWESDRQAAFLELTAALPGGRQFERQIVVLARDRVVLLADAVTTPDQPPSPATHQAGSTNRDSKNGSSGNGFSVHDLSPVDSLPGGSDAVGLSYASSLRMATGLEGEPAEETREVLAFDTRMRFMALPLALPEWRVGRGGSLEYRDGDLRLTQQSPGRRIYAPLWFDCDPSRIGGPLTWRQLTVADTRLNLPAYQATGFRIQAGLEQWLLYRSLDVARNRSLLGCNVSCEFLLGRIKPRGMVKRVLEIQ
jgi:hypothetical protein